MLRKILAAVAAGALITTFSLATISPADAAKRKRAKVVRVAPTPAAQIASCVTGIVFLPVKLAIKQPIC